MLMYSALAIMQWFSHSFELHGEVRCAHPENKTNFFFSNFDESKQMSLTKDF